MTVSVDIRWDDPRLTVSGDPPRTAGYRRLQSWYREHHLHARPGVRHGAKRAVGDETPPLLVGSMLHTDDVALRPELNFINEEAHEHANRRAIDCQREGGTLETGRLRHNMLSSMPLCFNLFGALRATRALVELIRLADPEADEIDLVSCEEKPTTTLGDKTAFDAYVVYRAGNGHRRFLGVETKYTEPFTQKTYEKTTYLAATERSGWFRTGAAGRLSAVPTNQLWRNLMLAAETERVHRYEHGRVLLLTTADDDAAHLASGSCRRDLLDPDHRLVHLKFDALIDAAEASGDRTLSTWAGDFRRRYLDLAPIGHGD